MTVGNALRRRKAYAEARPFLEEGLAMRRKVFGPDSSLVGDSLRRLARLSTDEGDLATAERLLLESTANWEKSLGPEHRDLTENWVHLAEILRVTDRSDEARALLERALALRTAQLCPTDPTANSARDELVTLLFARREWRH
jgi:tetratricopeptide (TPR) repeat protein